MMGDATVWGPPLAAVVMGLVGGLAAVWRFRARDSAVEHQSIEEDLRREHEAAVEALKSLELDQGKLDPDDYASEREALLKRGASALRALDEHRAAHAEADAAPAPAAAPPAPTGRIPGELRGALITLAVVGLIWLLVKGAEENSTPRRDGPMTGGTTAMGDAPDAFTAQGQAELAALEARIEQSPDDLALINEATRVAIVIQSLDKAMKYNQRAYELDPNNIDAICNKAIMAAMVGLNDRAIAGFEQVLAVDPAHADALTYKGLVLLQMGRAEEAVSALEKAVAAAPGNPGLQQVLAQARAQASGGAMPGAPAGAPPSQAPPSAPGEVVLAGTVSLDPAAAARVPQGGVLYLSVRSPGGGPPLAAKKLAPGPFPLDFTITTSDAIAMGGAPRPFPAAMNLSVRIDADGNPMSKDPSEPQATLEGVSRGASDLAITLR